MVDTVRQMAEVMERFDEYMERCLYGPDGFYSSGRGSAGRRGDFITSPEVGPLFGVLIGRWLDRVWDEAGQPEPFSVIDAGTGPGTLLRALVMAEPACAQAWDLIGVDRSVNEQRAEDHIRIQPSLPDDLGGSVIIANELLDNLPFRIVQNGKRNEGPIGDGEDRARSEWTESFVSEGRFVDVPMEDPGLELEPGAGPVPLLSGASTWVSDVLKQQPLRLLALDYGMETTADLAARGGWLRTYRTHGRGNDPLEEPGALDITTDIAVDQLPGSPRMTTQAEFLGELGISELVGEGRSVWEAKAARPDMEAFRMRSRISESEALTDPAGLGGWLVLEWTPRTS